MRFFGNFLFVQKVTPAERPRRTLKVPRRFFGEYEKGARRRNLLVLSRKNKDAELRSAHLKGGTAMPRKAKRDLTIEEQLARGPIDLPFLTLVCLLYTSDAADE